jgi:hypothetical protein
MDVRRLMLPAVYVLGLLLCGAGAASAQCANEGCQRPDPNSSCYTCTDTASDGYKCTVTSCSSCTESVCTVCDNNPGSIECDCSRGIPNACECLNQGGIYCDCYANGEILCGGPMAQPGPTGAAVKLPDVRHQILPKEMAALKKPSASGCQPLNLPKKLLFSL